MGIINGKGGNRPPISSPTIVIRVNLYEVFPLFGYVVLMEYGVYGTNRGASPALYTLIGVYIELFHVGEVGLVRGRMYATNRANVNAFRGFYPYARLCYYVCHNSPPFPNIIRWLFNPIIKSLCCVTFVGKIQRIFPAEIADPTTSWIRVSLGL
jgi:hypothetical protein